MKVVAYISIGSMLLSSFSYAGSKRLAQQKLLNAAVSKPSSLSKTPLKKWGEQKNFSIDPTPVTQINMKGEQIKKSESQGETKSNIDTSLSELKSGALSPFPNGVGSQNSNLVKNSNNSSNSAKGGGANAQDEDLSRKTPNAGGENSTGGQSQGQSFGLWWPVCVFVDGPDANSQIKEMVAMSAACGVNLVPYARTVSVSDPNNPDQLVSLQSQSCNIKEAGIAGKGSSLVLTNRSSTVADEMCGSYEPDNNGKQKLTKNVAGCNQLANGASGESKKRAASHKGQGDGFGGFASGEVAVGIVDSEGYKSGAVYSHEAMGHGQMGWPNGKKAGNGIGDPKDDKDSSGDHEHGGGYKDIGCGQMRASAIPDPQGFHKYYANKERYYSHREDKKMALGEPIWKTFKDGPDNNGLIADNKNGSPRGDDRDIRTSGGANSGTAGPGHKNQLGLASNTGKKGSGSRSSGSSGESSSGATKTQRGDDSPDGVGNAVGGGTGGPAEAKDTIVANKDAKNPNGENPMGGSGGVLDSNYFASSNSGQNGSSGSDTFSSGQNSGESSLVRTGKNSGKPNLDDDFFVSAKLKSIEARKDPGRYRKSPGGYKDQEIVSRTPSSGRPDNKNNRIQVSSGGS